MRSLIMLLSVCATIAAIADAGATEAESDKSGQMQMAGWGITNRAHELPMFMSGPYRGLHTVYNGPLYNFTMDNRGCGQIFVKENGEVVGKPIKLAFACQYHDRDNGNVVFGRAISKFSKTPQPVVTDSPLKIDLEAIFEDSVKCNVKLDIQESRLSIVGLGKDPPAIRNPSRFMYGFAIQKTHDDDSLPATFEGIKSLMSGWSLGIKGIDKRMDRQPFWKGLEPQSVEQVVMVGPWGKRTITITSPAKLFSTKKGRVPGAGSLCPYPTMPAYNGFSIGRNWHANGVDIGVLTVSFGTESGSRGNQEVRRP